MGMVNQTGGTFMSDGALCYIGYNFGSIGTYNISGTGLFNTKTYIGYSGMGTLNQSGGTITSSLLYIGYNSGSNGTYNFTGGTLITGSIYKGSGSFAFNFGGGTLKASSISIVRCQ